MKKDLKNNITHTRGDKGTIKLVNKNGTFKVGDKFKFSIVKKKDYSNVIFQKEFEVIEESTEFYLTFTNEEMRFGPIINDSVEYWYEIDMNDDTTLIGHEKNAKRFILLPEAAKKEASE